MGTDCAAEFLAHQFQGRTVGALDIDNIGNKRRIELDRQSRGQVHSQMLVGKEHDTVSRQDVGQQFANDFGIRVGEGIIGHFPHFPETRGHIIANPVQGITGADHDRIRCRPGINLLGRGGQFQRRIIDHPVLVQNICKYLSHYFSPPLAFKSSTSLSMISSVLPSRISAPSPISGKK